MTGLYILIGIIGCILNAILFCKVWNMCDNVAKITKKLCENSENTNVTKAICESSTAIESNEQSTLQTSETNESHNIAAGIIIAFILCSMILLMVMITLI